MIANTQWRRASMTIALASAALWAAGCGGAGLGLSGGSIPTGTIVGNISLPSGQPATSATVTANLVSTGQSVAVTSSVNTSGGFWVTGVPLSTDVEIEFQTPSGTLSTIVPASAVTGSAPVNIGVVSAQSTVVAAAIESDVSNQIDAPAEIVTSQLPALDAGAAAAAGSAVEQGREITSSSALSSAVVRLSIIAADSEIANVAKSPNQTTAQISLDGVFGYIGETGGTIPPLTSTERSDLIASLAAGKTHNSSDIVSDLEDVGVSTNSTDFTKADQYQRSQITAFSQFSGISALEALTVAAGPKSAGCYDLPGSQLEKFVDQIIEQ